MDHHAKSEMALDNELALPIDEFQHYHKALRTDDLDSIRNLIRDNESKEGIGTERFIHGYFTYNKTTFKPDKSNCNSYLSKPLHIAIVNGCQSVADFLLANNADACATDRYGNTIFHSLVLKPSSYRQWESRAIEIYENLLQTLKPEICQKLLLSENETGYRPVEYAAKIGTLRLLKRILYTDDVYVRKREIIGSTLYRWHDVTDYENGSRVIRSPLIHLPHLPRSRISDPDVEPILKSQLFQIWATGKLYSNLVPLFIWLLIRVCYFVMFFFVYDDKRPVAKMLEINDVNVSFFICPDVDRRLSEYTGDILIYSLGTTAMLILLFDIIDLAHNRYTGWKDNIMKSKDAIIDHWFFRFIQFLTNIVILSLLPVSYDYKIMLDFDRYEQYVVIMRCFSPLLCSWSILYFIQFLPSIGPAVNSIQLMLKDMMNFVLLYSIFLIPFYITFQTFMTTYSKTGCHPDFESDTESIFSLVLMMFNILDPREYDVIHQGYFNALFILYTFMCAIILLNFLIALMANTAARSKSENVVILQLNRLAVSCLVEKRFHWFFRAYYMQMRKWVFDVDQEGRVFIVTNEDLSA